MLISPAFAQDAASAPGGGLEMFMPFVLIIVIFYFLLWRPQQKKAKKHREMLGSLKRGDRIITGGGIYGRIARVEGERSEAEGREPEGSALDEGEDGGSVREATAQSSALENPRPVIRGCNVQDLFE